MANSQCGVINFYATDTIICEPNFTQFFITNLPAGATVAWDFGNGNLSGNTSPQRLYEVAGEYTIKLTITLINNAFCEIEKINDLKVKPKPLINVIWDKNKLCFGPDTVTFTDLSPNIKTRDYLLDGTLYNDVPKNFPYYFDSLQGIKSLYVFSTDSFGCRNVQSYDSAVYQYWGFDSLEVEIKYNPDSLTCGPMALTIQSVIPVPQNHVFQSYTWSISGPQNFISTQSQPNFVLPEGLYSVTHTFTNFGGCTYSITKDDWIQVYDSIDPIITNDKNTVCAGEDVTFTLTNSVGGEVSWNFNGVPVKIKSSTPTSITVGFNQIGTFGITVIYKNNDCIVTKSFNNLVTVNGPKPSFSIPLTKTCILPRNFRAINTSDLTGAGITQFFWEVKNQKTNQVAYSSTSPDSIVFAITDTAYYSIKLKTIGANGCIDSLEQQDAVGMDSLIPNFSIIPSPACPGQNIVLNALTLQGSTGILNQHYWEIYDKGTTTVLFKDSVNQKTIQLPDTGKYSVYLKAYNTEGCSGSKLFLDTIIVSKPTLTFDVSDSLPCRGKAFTLYSGFPRDEFPNYSTRWVLQHIDTNIILNSQFNRDSQQFTLNHPGIYKVRMAINGPGNQCRDTIDAPFRIKVSGIRMSLTTNSSLTGCEPLSVNWQGNVLGNYNFKNVTPNSFTWKAQNNMATFTNFAPPTGLTTTATYSRKGIHNTRIVASHGSGCNDSFYSSQFTVGTTANFSFGNTVRCINTSTQLSNTSLSASTFKWEVDSIGAVTFSPNDTTRNPILTVNREGDFYITLYSIGQGGCRDTMRRLLRVINPQPDFNSSDTVQFCAPVLSTFTPVPVWYGNQYKWYFGDGDSFVTNKPNPVSHVYTKNTDSFGVTVRLVVRTPGCSDTLDKIGYVKIIGPVPDYEFTINSGCEPLRVDFVNTSKNFSRFYFDYGDGTALDSTSFGDYAYTVMDKSFNVQCYKTKLILVDANGCFASEENPQDICVRKSPEPNFATLDTLGCEVYTSAFQNTSLYGVSFKWDFEGNDNFVNAPQFNPFYAYQTAGIYRPRLAAFNVNGCSDTTSINKLRIRVLPKPVSNFTPAADSICFDSPLQFFSQATSNNKIISHKWDFGDPASLNDTSSKINPFWSYKSPLSKFVTLVVTDSNNCKDTFGRFITVIDTIPPFNTGLNFVTVKDDKDILAVWPVSKVGQFSNYALYNDDAGFTKLFETFNRQDTSFLVTNGIDIKDKRYCYTLSTGDTCGSQSKFSPPHCTIFSTVNKNGPSRLLLNWVKYVGWPLDEFWGYIVYRSEDGGPFIPIDTLNNETDSHLDINLCEIDYCYYVEAVHNNLVWRSKSNTVCEKPDYIYPIEQVVPIKATVQNNKEVLVNWNPYTQMNNLSHYSINRLRHIDNVLINDFDTTTKLSYLDLDVDVQKSSYSYFISPVDLCGFAAPQSIVSKSILLVNEIKNYESNLIWNPYIEWSDGVLKYVIEKENSFGEFEYVAEVPANSTTYSFVGINVLDNEDVCLRVYAVRNNLEDTSYSNTACSIPESQVYIPTAFSPNGDGVNDVFKPSAIYIKNQTNNRLYTFEMEIFDRWGNKLFLSNDINLGWDGTFQNTLCPNGVYLYKIRAVGLDGKVFDFKGTLHLIR